VIDAETTKITTTQKSQNFQEFHNFPQKSGNSRNFRKMQKAHGARNGARQIGPDVENPKEIHTFWRGRFPPGM